MSTFVADLTRFQQKCKMRADQVVRKVVLDLGKEIVQRTPVDTGMARSNYFFGYDRVTTTDPSTSTSGGPSLTRAAAFTQDLKAGTVCYITNNLPYIMRLEYGYPGGSKQAPNGMARITVERFAQAVNEAARSLA